MTDEYAENSLPQQETIKNLQPYILKEFRNYILKNKNAIKQRKLLQIADLGCADGKNDAKLILNQLIQVAREELSKNFPINIFMNDLPSTSASTIIKNVSQEIHDQNVYFYAVPKSFYEKLFPERQIDVFLCLTTIHWLDKKHPVPIYEYVDDYSIKSYYHVDEAHKSYIDSKVYQHQEQTLQRFLILREKEIAIGGMIFIGNLQVRCEQANLQQSLYVFSQLRKILRQILDDFYVPTSVVNKMNLNIAQRQKDDFQHALENEQDLKESLKPILIEEVVFDDPIHHEFKLNKIDADQYGKTAANQLKAPTYNAYKGILVENGVEEKQAIKILNKYYEQVADFITQNYEKMPEQISAVICILERKNINQQQEQYYEEKQIKQSSYAKHQQVLDDLMD
eukprot:403334784